MLSLGEDDQYWSARLYQNVRNNIDGDIPIDVPPTKILEGMCPRHPRRGWRQWKVINHYLSHVLAGFWYPTNPVPDLHDTRTRNRRQQKGVDLWRRFLERVSWVPY